MPPFPYPGRIGRPVDGLRGAVRPVSPPEAPTRPRLPVAAGSLPLTVTRGRRAARSDLRDRVLFCHTRAATDIVEHERGSGASSPWLQPGVSAPQTR